MPCIFRVHIISEPFCIKIIIPVKALSHISRRIPGSSNYNCPMVYGRPGRVNLPIPVTLHWVYMYPQYCKTQLAGPVTKSCLPLCRCEVTDPDRMVHPAEAANKLFLICKIHPDINQICCLYT